MKKNNIFSRLGTAIAATAVTALGLVATAGGAYAADANIDPNEQLNLTIHKFEQPATVGESSQGYELDVDGSELEGLTPMPGVEFTVQKVESIGDTEIDLNDTNSWDFIAPIIEDGTFNPENAELSEGITGATGTNVTDEDGILRFENLDLGLYWVSETDPGEYNVTDAVPPFLVTLPLPGANAGDWIYDVHTYPKNSVTTATKTVDHSDSIGKGSNVGWDIAVNIPVLGDKTLRNFSISDTLPAGMEHGDHTITAENAEGNAVSLDDDDYNVSTDGLTKTVTFTEDGLEKLRVAQGGQVDFRVNSVVTDLGADGFEGVYENNAVVSVNDTDIDVTDNSFWGGIDIFKYTESGEGQNALDEAEFQVFATLEDAQNETNPISVDGAETFVTENNGIAVIDGLFAGNDGNGKTYWLVETKAPLGYLANTEPIEATVTPGDVTNYEFVEVANEQSPVTELEVTGAQGVIIASIIGAVLIGAGALLMRRKKENIA